MKAIRIIGYQNLVNYKKPLSLSFRESYSLPPYSSVIGMVHAACGYTDYCPMSVSVQGISSSRITNMMTVYEFGNLEEEGRHSFKVPVGSSYRGVSRGITDVELLVDMRLILHIALGDPEKTQEVCGRLLDPLEYPSLGRREDLIRFDDVRIVELECSELEDNIPSLMDIYVPAKYVSLEYPIRGSRVLVPKRYEIHLKTKQRMWVERPECVHALSGTEFGQGMPICVDRIPRDLLERNEMIGEGGRFRASEASDAEMADREIRIPVLFA